MTKSRRDINSLTPAQLDDYVHALGILRARSAANPDDPTGYDFQAALHNDMLVGPCEHGSDLFLPWHRSHLYHFEKLLQESDPPRTADVTLPYWDWLHPQAVGKFPPAFAQPGLAAGRNEQPVDLPPDTLEIVTQETDQGAFGGFPTSHPDADVGRLEVGPHNRMHSRFIGGAMGDPTKAAEDPIYYSFHAFIDLLWSEWRRRNGSPPLTSPGEDLRGFLSQDKHKVADFADTVALGYEYEYTEQLKNAFAVPTPAPVERRLLATAPLGLVSAPDFATQMRETSRAQFGLAAPPPEGRKVVVRLDELKVPLTGSYMLYAYLHPADVPFRADDAEFARRYGVGYASIWRAHAGPARGERHAGHEGAEPHPHHPPHYTVRFDVTPVLAQSPEATDTYVLTLQYQPSPPGDEAAGLVREVALKDVTMEVYD
ncbi:tyrosinase family protein [Kitasatospora sp. NPDC057692]|uniref:tyrosinase family protein n=1 Tax=Kitasatospora sp. NPDC057692 TaxID=3346215 RepID=UPI0036AFD13E